MDVFTDFTPLVERISIDEAFLDVTGSVHLFGAPETMGAQIRRRVREELGLPISVGVASTKHLAKVASQVAKPDGMVVVAAGEEEAFLDPLPVGLVWGVGPATRERMAAKGIHTIGALATVDPPALARLVGTAVGTKLGALAVNADARRVQLQRPNHSVGAQSALGRRTADDELVRTTLGFLADRVATRLRAKEWAGRTVTVRVRFADFTSVTRSRTARRATCSTRTLTDLAAALAQRVIRDRPEPRVITLLAISVSNLVPEVPLQLELPLRGADDVDRAGTVSGSARRALDHAVDAARERFGRDAVGYAAALMRAAGGVPDEFRELAESG